MYPFKITPGVGKLIADVKRQSGDAINITKYTAPVDRPMKIYRLKDRFTGQIVYQEIISP